VVRYWSVEEARAHLPRLRELLSRVRAGAAGAAHVQTNGHRSPGAGAAAALEELSEGDIILRDVDAGIVDYPARGVDGVVYHLCWRDPEDDLTWWHLPEEGFAGRKPLPRQP